MHELVTWLQHILTHLPPWLTAIMAVVTAASTVTALTPTPRDDRFIGRVYRVLEMLALNVGRAKDMAPNRAPKV